MEAIIKTRTPVRTSLTKRINEVDAEIKKENPDIKRLTVKMRTIQNIMAELLQLDQKVIQEMVKKHMTDQDIETETEQALEYRERAEFSLLDLETALASKNDSDEESVSATSRNGKQQSVKLPKIELQKFGGDLSEWLGWWAQFEKIHKNADLVPADKFQYLIQATVPGSRARELVEGYPPSAANYPKVIEAMEKRFGKETLLIQVYVRKLLRMVINNTNSKEKIKISGMFDKLQSHLRALNSLGVTADKYAAMLFPIVESSLPEEILWVWQRSSLSSKDGSTESPPKSQLDYLMEFLEEEVENEERVHMASEDYSNSTPSRKQSSTSKKQSPKEIREEDQPTAIGLHAGEATLCLFCERQHESCMCMNTRNLSLEERKAKVRSARACFACLRVGHITKKCRCRIRCLICKGHHYPILCPQTEQSKNSRKPSKPMTDSQDKDEEIVISSFNHSKDVVLQTLAVKLTNGNKQKLVRALIDGGSQRSYILQKTADELGLQSIGEANLCHVLFGGSKELKHHKKYEISVHQPRNGNLTIMQVLSQGQICEPIPKIKKGAWLRELKERHVWIDDLEPGSEEIEVLIGADNYSRILTGKMFRISNGLTAIETTIGWTLMGENINHESSTAMLVTSLLNSAFSVPQLWEMENIGIVDPVEHLTQQEKEEAVMEHFRRTVVRSSSGRYRVSLPWICDRKRIPSNKQIAEARLRATTTKLKKSDMFAQYDEVVDSWLKEGFIEEVVSDGTEVVCHYLPHRPVIKPESLTTPVRPVFDASCRSGRNQSLNDCLEKGVNLIKRIPEVLLRFREKNIGLVADIRKAFQMIEVEESDRDYLRFLWWEKNNLDLKIYRHKRVVFGLTSSPFLLMAVIEYHLGAVTEHCDVAEKLLQSLYVDNCLTSVDTIEEYMTFKQVSTRLLGDAGMELTQWGVGSSKTVPLEQDVSNDNCLSVLGLKWNRVDDTLQCDWVQRGYPERPTKRKLLSFIQKIYDPIGFLCPVLVLPKILLQETWGNKTGWDEDLEKGLTFRFSKWCQELQALEEIKIPRNVAAGTSDKSYWQLHTFCDASLKAYASAVFLRVEQGTSISVQLLLAKSRVAPIKSISIPRLELLSCLIGTRLAQSVLTVLDLASVPQYFWSDSSTALAWIKGGGEWNLFVANRVKEIAQFTTSEQWHHVPGSCNPADLPSRGCSPSELLRSKWWEGPAWLREAEDRWPMVEPVLVEEEIKAEAKKRATISMSNRHATLPWYVTQSSSYLKTLRLLARWKQFISYLSGTSADHLDKVLRLTDLQLAENCLFRMIQRETFPSEVHIIENIRVSERRGLYCVQTKLIYKTDTDNYRYPVLLPGDHPAVEQLVQHYHLSYCHAGVQFLMGKLREKCWIIRARQTIKKIIGKCVVCKRFAEKPTQVESIALPQDRVETGKVFEVVGVDLAGPLYLCGGQKSWLVLYTCAVYRCVHLELVTSLSTEDFLRSFVRFISRRGRPRVVYSDNGTNFVGAVNLFNPIDWKQVESHGIKHQINWKFNPPSAAWWGGWWERLIRLVKDLLKRTLGMSKLTYDELLTHLCSAEFIINSRPLTFVSEEQNDLIPLTPAMFLMDLYDADLPEVQSQNGDCLRKAYKRGLNLRDELIRRFRSEYLALLIQRGGSGKNYKFTVGDVVLMGSDDKKRLNWPMARILELFPGKDGIVRVARVKTSGGNCIRPLQRLYPLEVSSPQECPPITPVIIQRAVNFNQPVKTSVSVPESDSKAKEI